MIETLVPPAVRACEAFVDREDITLFPEEQAANARAIDKRRREYTTVRACARDALGQLGITPAPLVAGERGAPVWPKGVVGSMTHRAGYRAAAVAHRGQVRSVGIDAEPDARLPDGLVDTIAVPADLPSLEAFANTCVAADRLLFSAKESVYKAWFPLARRWLGFNDATVHLRLDGTFTARLLVDGTVDEGSPLTGFEGRWLAARGLVLTAIVVEIA